jgi:hypothetical protein
MPSSVVKKPSKITVKLQVNIDVPFVDYGKAKLNRRAVKAIKDWVEGTIKNELSFVTLYVEKDDKGCWIEDCSGFTKISVKEIK